MDDATRSIYRLPHMTATGPNDPCPCASGKKFKRCCGRPRRDSVVVAAELHDLDGEVVTEILQFARDEVGDEVRRAFRALPFPEGAGDDFVQVAVPYVIQEARFDGRSLVERFLSRQGDRLSWRKRAWLDSSLASWFSVWEVEEIEPERSIQLRDLLTGEERTVTERSAGRALGPRYAILARVVDHAGLSLLVGSHPRSLDARGAADVVEAAQASLKSPAGKVPRERLRGGFSVTLLGYWQEAVARADARPLPTLQNTDGDPLVWTEDTFALGLDDRDEVVRAVAALDGVERDVNEHDIDAFRWVRAGGALGAESMTSLGRIEVSATTMKLVANSERRADELRVRVTSACGRVLRFEERSSKDMQDFAASSMGRARTERPVTDIPPEAARLMREFKERHYVSWPDTAVPALDGLTPRAAASAGRSMRTRLDVLLKEIESAESAEPPPSRYNVKRLRRTLGL